MQHAKLRTEEDAEIKIKTWVSEGDIWLSVLENGSSSDEISSVSTTSEGSDSHLTSFSHGQMELALVKLFAEQMGCQVWIQQVKTGGHSVAVCFSNDELDTSKDSI
jgi:K+-sensing histidine kinase KdpD